MSDENKAPEIKPTLTEGSERETTSNPSTTQATTEHPAKDSFNVPVKKSPLLLYALLQIPLVLFMVILLYFMYQAKQD